jgi:hypothetical protein
MVIGVDVTQVVAAEEQIRGAGADGGVAIEIAIRPVPVGSFKPSMRPVDMSAEKPV